MAINQTRKFERDRGDSEQQESGILSAFDSIFQSAVADFRRAVAETVSGNEQPAESKPEESIVQHNNKTGQTEFSFAPKKLAELYGYKMNDENPSKLASISAADKKLFDSV